MRNEFVNSAVTALEQCKNANARNRAREQRVLQIYPLGRFAKRAIIREGFSRRKLQAFVRMTSGQPRLRCCALMFSGANESKLMY